MAQQQQLIASASHARQQEQQQLLGGGTPSGLARLRRQEVPNPYPAVASPANCSIATKASNVDSSEILSTAVWLSAPEGGQLYIAPKSEVCIRAQVSNLAPCIDEYPKVEGCCGVACAAGLRSLAQNPETQGCVDEDLARLCLVKFNNSLVPADRLQSVLQYLDVLANTAKRCLTGQDFVCSKSLYQPPPPPSRPPSSPPPARDPPTPPPPSPSPVAPPVRLAPPDYTLTIPRDFLTPPPSPQSSSTLTRPFKALARAAGLAGGLPMVVAVLVGVAASMLAVLGQNLL